MNGEILQVGNLREKKNFVPLPYRRVSYQPYDGPFSAGGIRDWLLQREVYRRTDIVVLHATDGRHAVAAIQRKASDSLFTRVAAVEVLGLPADCVFLRSDHTDPANPSALACLAREHSIGHERTLIVHGMFDHINIIHRPDPLVLRVVEVVPPSPAKLFRLAQQVLTYAPLPPICLELEPISLPELCAELKPEAFLVPCRSGGLENLNAPLYYLDERPPERADWTLIGCERSLQFHRHYYGDEPPRVEMCPRQRAGNCTRPTLLKCCLLEYDFEHEQNLTVVPWGSDLAMVETALRKIAAEVEYG